MQKLKSLSFSKVLNVLKICLFGIVITLVGTVLFAVVLKFTDLSSNTIGYVNNFIKALSLFVIVAIIKKNKPKNLLISAVVGGLVYAVLTFVIYSILSGSFNVGASLLFDVLFAVIVAVIVAVILNITKKRN